MSTQTALTREETIAELRKLEGHVVGLGSSTGPLGFREERYPRRKGGPLPPRTVLTVEALGWLFVEDIEGGARTEDGGIEIRFVHNDREGAVSVYAMEESP